MAFGVNIDGFTLKTLEDILEEIVADQREDVDPAIDTSSESPVGQMNGVFSNQLAQGWEVLQTAYKAFDPDAAEGDALDALASLTGTTRDLATKTQLTKVSVNIDDTFSQLAGTMFATRVNDPDVRFTNTELVENISGGTLDVLTKWEAEDTGDTVVNSESLIVIAEPLAGWNSITNDQGSPDFSTTVIGTDVQTDDELRTSREEELRASGGATQPAIDAALEALDGMISVDVFFNDQDFTDANGLPPHSIECLTFDGETPSIADSVISQTIFDVKAAGIKAFGSTQAAAIDSEGNIVSIDFSRPTLQDIWIEVDITKDPDNIIADAALISAVEASVVAEGTATATPGRTVFRLELECATIDTPGVIDIVGQMRLGFTASPVGTANLATPLRSLAVYSTARVLVTIIP